MLSSLSQQPLERSYVRPIQSSPLWTGEQTQPDTAQLAGKLHDALSHSGLFYESHQAQWIAGSRPTTQLMLEPQNQIPKNQLAQTQLPQNTQATNAETPSITTPSAQTGGEPRPVANTIPAHLQTLVQQQLNALETRQVLWQGQVWQDQEMRWEVHEDAPHPNAEGTTEKQWTTQINLDLPNLGGISARLSFNGNALNLTLEVSDTNTREKLGSASSQLIAVLTERGIPVTHTQITQNEHAG
jgi:flagellar hook-length control protein FliK